MSSTPSRIAIVGAGPGAPDLLTRRAEDRLKTADVLIWTDSLVSPQIAALASQRCERIRTSNLTLEEVLPVMIDRARKGLRVVRLHDGDPVFMEPCLSRSADWLMPVSALRSCLG